MRGVYHLCAAKTKINTPLMYKVLDKDTIKSEILSNLSVTKRSLVMKSDLLNRYDTTLSIWKAWNYIAFIVILF